MQLQNLKTNFVGQDFRYFEKIDSTQAEIWRQLENNTIKNGSLVLANLQTNGIGTHGRNWYIDEAGNITFSLFIETNCKAKKLDGLTLDIAEIFIDIFKNLYNIKLEIKSPNDIIYNSKKIGGILVQSKSYKEIIKYLVIGVGINTNGKIFNKEIENIATSIKNEFNIEIDNLKVISCFCNLFEEIIIKRSKQ